MSCNVVPQAGCPRWCPCSRARWTAGRLYRSVWPNLSVKNCTDSWTTAWTKKPLCRSFLKSAKPALMPRMPCCTIGPCRSASASADHAKRLSVSECTGPCASHRVRNLYVCHYMHLYVYGCVGEWMYMNAYLGMCVHEWKFCIGEYLGLGDMMISYSTTNGVRIHMKFGKKVMLEVPRSSCKFQSVSFFISDVVSPPTTSLHLTV